MCAGQSQSPGTARQSSVCCLGVSALSLQRLSALVPTRWNSYFQVLGALPSGVFLGGCG